MKQSTLNITTQPTGPVECLGQSFPSEEARREHYLKLLAQKLKDPEFRKIEGFPIGKDEDILALSDPPYYTACPNPWLGDFIKHYGKPYDPKQPYHREPFAADVSEGKADPLYKLCAYYTKVPPRAIQRYIDHYTAPGDIVLDGFCGSGMTGVAARLDKNKSRTAILIDLSPAAAFTAAQMNSPLDKALLQDGFIEEWVTEHLDPLYGKNFDYAIWSEWFVCPECANLIKMIDHAIDYEQTCILSSFPCPKCRSILTVRKLKRFFTTSHDFWLEAQTSIAKTTLELVSKRTGSQALRRLATPNDAQLAQSASRLPLSRPPLPLPYTHMTHERNQLPANWGITHIHQFYTARNFVALDRIASIPDYGLRHTMLFAALSILDNNATRRNRFYVDKRRPKGSPIGPLSHTLYIPALQVETHIGKKILEFKRDACGLAIGWPNGYSIISTQSATSMAQIPDSSIDFVFTDPPFGGNINYSDQNQLPEWWLKISTDTRPEAITNSVQKKGLSEYQHLIYKVFLEYYRVLKPGRWMVVEFHNSSNAVWTAIQTALQQSGFVVASVALLDKIQTTLHQDHKPNAVEKDLAITAYKPTSRLETRFATRGETEEGVWDFITSHLQNLPISKIKAGQLEYLSERGPRVLYDRMVAFYMGHSTPVPLSAAEFHSGLTEKFPEREGMFFLPEQVSQYDTHRARAESVGQLTIFVEDERSAIDWLRSFLKSRPSSFHDIQPEFLQQLGASWKTWESRPELKTLLDQNFLCYDGDGEVPSQIHGYLSTQYKDLRSLPKEAPQLQAKAKSRWYVPDPKKNVDVESLRNKRLLEEFWSYLPDDYTPPALTGTKGQASSGLSVPRPKIPKGKKLKELRSEAIRAGFKQCYQLKDYQTILLVAELIPESMLQEDEQLQMTYDNAVTRIGGA